MSHNPTDLLATRHRPYRQARDRYQRAVAAREAAQQSVTELESKLVAAESRDRVQLGDALVDGRKPPTSEAEGARAALEAAKRHTEALQYAEQRAAGSLDTLPKENQTEWLREADAELAHARDAYESAIRALVDARDKLADEATLVGFLEHGAQVGQPIGGALRKLGANKVVEAIPFAHVVELMLTEAGDVEEKARLDPNRPQPEPQYHQLHRA